MKSFWNWVVEPFVKPGYLITVWDSFRMGLTVLIGVGIILGIIWLLLTILEKIGVI